ncbi:MAG: hypothetical protein V9G19_02000 [Tetrasphaera sp.]
MMLDTLNQGRSATFYVDPALAERIMRIYWTPRRIQEIGMELVSEEVRRRIESELASPTWGRGIPTRRCRTAR